MVTSPAPVAGRAAGAAPAPGQAPPWRSVAAGLARTIVVVSAEDWQRLDELESAESTAWWRRDAAERAAQGEEPDAGEEGPGLDEAAFRRRFAHLLHDAGAA